MIDCIDELNPSGKVVADYIPNGDGSLGRAFLLLGAAILLKLTGEFDRNDLRDASLLHSYPVHDVRQFDRPFIVGYYYELRYLEKLFQYI